MFDNVYHALREGELKVLVRPESNGEVIRLELLCPELQVHRGTREVTVRRGLHDLERDISTHTGFPMPTNYEFWLNGYNNHDLDASAEPHAIDAYLFKGGERMITLFHNPQKNLIVAKTNDGLVGMAPTVERAYYELEYLLSRNAEMINNKL